MQLYRPTDLCLYMQSALHELIQRFVHVKQKKKMHDKMLMRTGPINSQFPCQGCCMSGNTCSHPPMRSQSYTFPGADLAQSLGHQKLPVSSWATATQLSIVLPTWLTEKVPEFWDQYYRKKYLLLTFQEKKKIKPKYSEISIPLPVCERLMEYYPVLK